MDAAVTSKRELDEGESVVPSGCEPFLTRWSKRYGARALGDRPNPAGCLSSGRLVRRTVARILRRHFTRDRPRRASLRDVSATPRVACARRALAYGSTRRTALPVALPFEGGFRRSRAVPGGQKR